MLKKAETLFARAETLGNPQETLWETLETASETLTETLLDSAPLHEKNAGHDVSYYLIACMTLRAKT